MAENRAPEYTEGTPCWADAQLPDVEAGKRFYGDLFGWTFEERPGRHRGSRGAVRALKDGEPVASLAQKTDGRLPTVWTVSFATPDAEALCERIRVAGGQVVSAPLPLDDLGVTALVTDPEGAVFALWQSAGHPGFGRRHEPGSFAWVQLYARDTEAANAFYGGLFHDALFGPGADPHFGRAPVSDVFPAEMPPHFLVHFAVEDPAATMEEVTRLGGRVQVPPFETSYGTAAVVTDNQGASFALLGR
ncbi:Putative glyoxylase CFP32 [Streptomyces sp. enrichment culture]|uniref:VOC family protein n=1 Tax=Streptomyces sp. enrichment culture TaxID=1795815 RepID=UPI003F548FAE